MPFSAEIVLPVGILVSALALFGACYLWARHKDKHVHYEKKA